MSAALQICYTAFDSAFFKLPPNVRLRIEAKVDEMGLRLKTFPYHRLKGHNRYRLRVGDFAPSIPTDPYLAPLMPYRLELMNGIKLMAWLNELTKLK